MKTNHLYRHPDHGVIRVLGGQYMGSFDRVSNFWDWEIVATGERVSGYANVPMVDLGVDPEEEA